MTLSELPSEIQEQLKAKMHDLHNHNINSPYHICLYNEIGTRYFNAHRVQTPYGDDKGHYMPFGGGSEWEISYGAIGWHTYRNPVGEKVYGTTLGHRYGRLKRNDGSYLEIPSKLKTKAEVVALVKEIGKFNI